MTVSHVISIVVVMFIRLNDNTLVGHPSYSCIHKLNICPGTLLLLSGYLPTR